MLRERQNGFSILNSGAVASAANAKFPQQPWCGLRLMHASERANERVYACTREYWKFPFLTPSRLNANQQSADRRGLRSNAGKQREPHAERFLIFDLHPTRECADLQEWERKHASALTAEPLRERKRPKTNHLHRCRWRNVIALVFLIYARHDTRSIHSPRKQWQMNMFCPTGKQYCDVQNDM